MVENSVKFTFQGSIIIEVNPDYLNPNLIQITVKDTGIGIDLV